MHCTSLYYISIHPKRRIPWIPESADNFEFSAERLSENVKTIKIILLALFSHKILSREFTHFFRRFFLTEKQNPFLDVCTYHPQHVDVVQCDGPYGWYGGYGGEIDDGDEKVLGVMHSQWSQKGGRSGREGVGKPLQGKATLQLGKASLCNLQGNTTAGKGKPLQLARQQYSWVRQATKNIAQQGKPLQGRATLQLGKASHYKARILHSKALKGSKAGQKQGIWKYILKNLTFSFSASDRCNINFQCEHNQTLWTLHTRVNFRTVVHSTLHMANEIHCKL